MSCHDIGRGNARLFQQRVKFSINRERVTRPVYWFAPAHSGAVIGADLRVFRQLALNPIPPQGLCTRTSLQNDCRTAFAHTDHMHPVSVDGVELTTRCVITFVQFGGDCQPLGGSFLTVGAFEWIFPTPFVKRGDDSTQFSAFIDVGNVFEDFDAFDAGELRASIGLSFKWQAPVGPIIVNLAKPLIEEDGDRTETLQFAFGSAF